MRDIRDPQAISEIYADLRERHPGPHPRLSEIYDMYEERFDKARRYPGNYSMVDELIEQYKCELADEAVQGMETAHRRLFDLVPDDEERETYLAAATTRMSATLAGANGQAGSSTQEAESLTERAAAAELPTRRVVAGGRVQTCERTDPHNQHVYQAYILATDQDEIIRCPGVPESAPPV